MWGTGITNMSWTFSKSLPDNQKRLWFSSLYIQRPSLELSPSKLDISVSAHTTFWTFRWNLKVGKERLEDCMLKKSRAWKERNLPTNTQCLDRTIEYFTKIAMYQHIFHNLCFSKWWLQYRWRAVVGCYRWVQPVCSASVRKKNIVVIPYLLPAPRGKKEVKAENKKNFLWSLLQIPLTIQSNKVTFYEELVSGHSSIFQLWNDNSIIMHFWRINVSEKRDWVQTFKEAHCYKKQQQVLISINQIKKKINSVITPVFCWKWTWSSSLWQYLQEVGIIIKVFP